MRTFFALATAVLAIVLTVGCGSDEPAALTDADETAHMIAEARLTAH